MGILDLFRSDTRKELKDYKRRFEHISALYDKKDDGHRRYVRSIEDEYRREIEMLKHDAKLERQVADSDHAAELSALNVKIKEVRLETKAAYEDALSYAKIEAAEANALSSARLEVIEEKDNTIAKMKEVMEFMATKIPDLDLSKAGLNFNVDIQVPANRVQEQKKNS